MDLFGLCPPGVLMRKPTCLIRLADPGDANDRFAIERLWADNLSSLDSSIIPARYDWLYRQNPAGHAHTWLAIDADDGRIVGCASVLPREMAVGGELLQGGIAIDFAVDRLYRTFGVALQLQRAISREVWGQGIQLMFCFPNKASRGVFQRVGYRKAGECWRGAQLLRSYPKLRERGYSRPAATVAGFCIDLIFYLRNTLFSEQRGVRGELTDAADERWERFWNRILPDLQFGGAHNLDYLRWRYQHCPFGSHRFYGLFDRNDSLLGYIIFTRQGDVLIIDDFQVLNQGLLKPLLARFWKEMQGSGATAINASVVGSASLLEHLGQSGFVARGVDGWAGLLTAPGLETELPGVLATTGGKWYMADAEVDL